MSLFYSFLLTLGFLALSPLFLLRREKYAAGFRQRLGELPPFEQDGRMVVWLHCVSVGEANAARPLVDEIKREFPECRLVVSTTTRTGQRLARDIFREQADSIFYFPFDWRFSVRRALRNYRPAVVLLMETEIWFNFLREARRAGARTVIVNGRLSEKSFRGYSYIKSFMRLALAHVDLALMQGARDAERLIALGIEPEKVKVTGNVKFDQPAGDGESDLTREFRERFAVTRAAPVLLAASTHAPEEKWILEAFKKVSGRLPSVRTRLLIAPRHPERFDEAAATIEKSGFSFVRRSAEPSERDRAAEVILLDSIGELRSAYPLAEIVFVGGSLIPHGGQSILEPAAAGKAVVTGFYTMNFAAAVKEFLAKKALVQLPETREADAAERLAQTFLELLQDAGRREQLARNAVAVMQENRGATRKTVENLKSFLEPSAR